MNGLHYDVVGIDPSLAHMGVARVNGLVSWDTDDFGDFGRGKDKLNLMEYFARVDEAIRLLVESYSPQLIVMEGSLYSKFANTAPLVGMNHVLRYLVWKRGVDCLLVYPSQVNSVAGVGGKGATTKVRKLANRDAAIDLFGNKAALCNEHCCDALLLAFLGLVYRASSLDVQSVKQVACYDKALKCCGVMRGKLDQYYFKGSSNG